PALCACRSTAPSADRSRRRGWRRSDRAALAAPATARLRKTLRARRLLRKRNAKPARRELSSLKSLLKEEPDFRIAISEKAGSNAMSSGRAPLSLHIDDVRIDHSRCCRRRMTHGIRARTWRGTTAFRWRRPEILLRLSQCREPGIQRRARMDTRELHDKGLKLRRDMFGTAAVDQRMAAFGTFGEPLQHIINAYAYGD